MEKEQKHHKEKSTGNISRRTMIGGAVTAAIIPVISSFTKYIQAGVPIPSPAIDDPTKKIGPGPGKLGKRSTFEQPVKKPSDISSRSPLQDFYSTITPSDLHYERHHAGIPFIDPSQYDTRYG